MTAVPLDTFRAELERLRGDAEAALMAAADAAAVEAARIEFLGAKSGRLKAIQKSLGGLAGADKPAGGKQFNDTKNAITACFEAAEARVASGGSGSAVSAIDVTLPAERFRLGHLHPITKTIRRVQEIMCRLGFESVDGPSRSERSTRPATRSTTSISQSPATPTRCCSGRRPAPCRSA